MTAVAAIIVCLLTIGCGRTLTIYHRTSPRRAEVSKLVAPSLPFAFAVRRGPNTIELHLKRASLVTLRRVLHYNSSAIIYDHSGSALNEIAEFVMGLVLLLAPAAWAETDEDDEVDTPTRKLVRRRAYLVAMFDPTTSVGANQVRTEPVVKEQIFSDPPVFREYEIRVPLPSAVVLFRVLDVAGHEVARGSATTDLHGELLIEDASCEPAIAVELTTEGTRLIVPVLADDTPVDLASGKPQEPLRRDRLSW